MPKGVYVRTEETKQKLRDIALNRPDGWWKNNCVIGKKLCGESNGFFGKHLSDDAKDKLRLANTGRIPSDETRRKMSIATKGKPKSEACRAHMMEAAKLRPPRSEEWCRHISDSKKGKTLCLSNESRERSRIATIARNKLPMSDATRKKMSDAKKGIAPPHGACIKGIEKLKVLWKDPGYKKLHCRIGDNNPNWKGGSSFEPYCPKFNPEFRERVRAFFNYTCQVCGHVWQPGEIRLSVHHVNYNKSTCCNNEIPLFVPVCAYTCHGRTNAHRKFWESWFTEIINEFYNGKCYYSNEEMQSINILNL